MQNGSEPSPAARTKVHNACQRCRRQKLKCDSSRPCTLCTRAGITCTSGPDSRWRVYQPPQASTSGRPSKRPRRGAPGPPNTANIGGENHDSSSHLSERPSSADVRRETESAAPHSTGQTNDLAWTSSSTMSLVDGAFLLHNSSTVPATNAIPGGQPGNDSGDEPIRNLPGSSLNSRTARTVNHTRLALNNASHSAVLELISLFPGYEVAALLVDTYFDRVHWFMLIFHQDEFRQRWPGLYATADLQSGAYSHNIGFICTFLMVITIGLQYAGDYRRRRLQDLGIDPDSLKQRILSAIKTRLLDIVSLGTLEVVQTCILLGTFYLYHGAPRLASPVCGCGLRVAQALNLHRRLPDRQLGSSSGTENHRMKNESRKRSWWAIYEIETFSSMTYGYPHSIKDTDYDVEPLDPSAKLQAARSPTSFDKPLRCEVTLLSYKYFMSKLSVLTKEGLTELYGIGSPANLPGPGHLASPLQDTISKVTKLDAQLQSWSSELPSKLVWAQSPDVSPSYSSPEELDRDIGARGTRFENHIFELQALTLKLAYENARMLVHRPLLSYKSVESFSKSTVDCLQRSSSSHSNPLAHSLETCRHSALQISEILYSPMVDLISATYAAAFVSIHTFSAGVLLAILSSMDPLTPESREAKVGLHRLMGIQEKLRDRCVLAAQGLEILQRLTRLVMEKELNTMLDLSKSSQQPSVGDARRATDGATDTGCNIEHNPGSTVASSDNAGLNAVTLERGPRGSDSADASNDPPSGCPLPNFVNSDSYTRYIEDPALSEALFDFDQALMTFAPQPDLDIDDNLAQPSRFTAEETLPMLEQTWIWGLENIPPYDGT